jgi:AcrR family transcriptional regulator
MALTDTQEQILGAAIACIARDGIDGASMRAVATEADVSLGLLSYHFDDKQSLIVAAFQLACDRLLERSMESLEGVAGSDARVRAFIRGSFREEFLHPDYLRLRLSIWAAGRIDPRIDAVDRSMYDVYAEQMAGLIVDVRPELGHSGAIQRAIDVTVTQNGLWLNWARYADQVALERGLARCEEIALSGA